MLYMLFRKPCPFAEPAWDECIPGHGTKGNRPFLVADFGGKKRVVPTGQRSDQNPAGCELPGCLL